MRDEKWEELPVVVEGNYGFNAVAHMINPGTITERELNWEWLYGALAPGEYRISKSLQDFRGTADYDEYEICARFALY